MKDTALLIPRFAHPAIEERYAAAQSRLLLQRSAGASAVVEYDADEPARAIAGRVSATTVIAITDPLIALGRDLARILAGRLDAGAAVALPAANESPNTNQQRAPYLGYLTLFQFEEAAARAATARPADGTVTWDGSDPAVFACRTALLRESDAPLRRFLEGRPVSIVPEAFIHRFTTHRGQARPDLLARIPATAKSVLEFGCGEGALGAAVKQRQECRFVGLELDEDAAAVARTRIDDVHVGDVRTIVPTLGEKFDAIIGGDIVEHLDDPWTFLAALRRVARPGSRLILSLPNIGSWPVVRDLLHGRFDYVYLGLLCAGHLRFFTRRTIEDMLAMAEWDVVAIETQDAFATPEGDAFIAALEAAGQKVNRTDLLAPGFYVIATPALKS